MPPWPRRPLWGYNALDPSATSDPRRPAENRHCLLLMGLCNPTVETSCMHADDAHAEKPPCPWRPFLLDRQVDPRQSARPQLAMQQPTRLKCPWSRACLYYLLTLPTSTPPALFSTPGSYRQPRGYCRLVICTPKQDWHRLLLPSDSTRISGETMP